MLTDEMMVETRVKELWEYGRLFGMAHADMDPVRSKSFSYLSYPSVFCFTSSDQDISSYSFLI